MRLADHPYLQPLTRFERGLGIVICLSAAGGGLWMAGRAWLHPELISGGRWLLVALGTGGASFLLVIANRLRRPAAPDTRLIPTAVLAGVGTLMVVASGWLLAIEDEHRTRPGLLGYLGMLALYAAWLRWRAPATRPSVRDGA